MADTNRITITMEGTTNENGDIRLTDFIEKLEALRRVLAETARIVSDRDAVYFRVAELSHSSPTAVGLEAIPNNRQTDVAIATVKKLYEGIIEIDSGGRPPPEYDYPWMEAVREVANFKDRSMTGVTLSLNGSSVFISEYFATQVEAALGPDIFEDGSITGMLQAINLHGRQLTFVIYSTSGKRRIRCTFPQSLRKEAVAAVDQYVEVYGRLKYKMNDPYPYEVMARRVDVYESEDGKYAAPDLLGIAPDATGDKSSEDFVRDIRDDW